MKPPAAAIVYDGLSTNGFEALWSGWQCATFATDEAHGVLDAIESDRMSVATFKKREPRAARSVADYLQVWLGYLDLLEEVTRDLMCADTDAPGGSVPHRILLAGTFADAVADESEAAG